MDDDDEFGDLYTDVLLPFTATHPSIISSSSANPSKPDLNLESDDEDGAPDPKFCTPSTTFNLDLRPKVEKPEFELHHGETSSSKQNFIGGDRFLEVKKENIDENLENVEGVGVLDSQNRQLLGEVARVSENLSPTEEIATADIKASDSDKDRGSVDKDGIFVKEEVVEIDIGMDDLGSEPIIPGLSAAPFIPGVSNGGDVKDMRREETGGVEDDGGGDDWDSDSEDDLQIVLNDQSGHHGMDMNEGMGSDEDGVDLVIVADSNQPHQPNEQEWGDDPNQAADGETKEAGDPVKVNGGVMNTAGTRIGYGNHVYPSHHSQFKYVRPGVAVPGGPIVGPGGVPGQVRPLTNMGPGVGRGRGDWRPMGIKTAPGMQRPFQPGFGPTWGNNSAGRGFGSGAEFTLPSHKTVFDIDIDTFEDKLWRNPGVDLSDFFNFGMDEESWKDYCKQLEQLRLEATMQSRIRVYESGRSEPEYDPDLPPELAAAAGTSIGNAIPIKPDGTLNDLSGQERGSLNGRPPIPPTGRAIQVEAGYGERLPSIDTRPPRLRDSDAIIEIVLQGSGDDDPMANDDQIDDHKQEDVEEDVGQTDYFDPHLARQPYNNNRKREMMGRGGYGNHNIHDGNGLLPFPPETSHQFNPGSRGRMPNHSDGRWSTRDRYSRERGNDVIPCEDVHKNKVNDGGEREKSGESINGKSTSPSVKREASIDGSKGDMENEVELGDKSSGGGLEEGDDTSKDVIVKIPSGKRQKLSSRVEQPKVQDAPAGGVDSSSLRGSRARSSDNSRARSGSSRDYQKPRDDGEEEVAQGEGGRPRRVEDMKRRRVEDDYNYRGGRKDEHVHVRQDVDRNRVFAKGREDSLMPYPYRDWDANNQTHPSRVKTNEKDVRQRRDDDIRKRDPLLHSRSKVRESEKEEHSRKRGADNADWKGAPDKEVVAVGSTRQREKEEHLLRQREQAEYRGGAREDPSRRKRPRDDGLDQQRKRDEPRPRVRDIRAVEDNNNRHREDSWRPTREKDERILKQPHEERNSGRSGRDIEDSKTWAGNSRGVKETELKRKPSRVEDEVFASHHQHGSSRGRENQFVSDDRNAPRHSDRPSDRHRDSGRSKESDGLGSSKRKQEVSSSNKGGSEISKKSPPRHSSRRHKEDAPPPPASDDEQQQISRKGRSKLERWTSNKDRDDNNISKSKETDEQIRTVGSVEEQYHAPVEEESCNKDGGVNTDPEKVGGDDKHLDTVAKLKKRSERFKTPMPSDKEKDSTHLEVSGDAAEVKPERPARKRRWISG